MQQLYKSAIFTDIHFGRKSNSEVHNTDCLNFIKWFCSKVKQDPDIDHVLFLGDWNENRSSLNIQTLKYSYEGARLINDLGIPVFFLVGNHDLYYRHSREIHSVIPFHEFDNFHLIEEVTVIDHIGEGALLCPFIFHQEYPELLKYSNIPFWAGHFEFNGFELTGSGTKMVGGPDPDNFKGPDIILSGHFHKRQASPNNNIVYVGNTFPMDFSDANDVDRGMATFDHNTKELLFHNWDQCPTYIRANLSDLIADPMRLRENAFVKCVVDIPISFDESVTIRQTMINDHKLREFILDEISNIADAVSDTEVTIDIPEEDIENNDDMIVQLLTEIEVEEIDSNLLIKIYEDLKNDSI